MGNMSKAREIEKDMADVTRGRRRAESIYSKHLGMVETLPDNIQKKLMRQRSSLKMVVSEELRGQTDSIAEGGEGIEEEEEEEEEGETEERAS